MSLEKYIPSEDLAKFAVKQMRKTATLPLLVSVLFPATWINPGFREPFLYNLSLISSHAKENMQKHLEERFYGAVNNLCFRNLAFESADETTRKQYMQIPENPKLSIISDSGDSFDQKFLNILVEYTPGVEPCMTEWNQEFYDYVSRTEGFGTKLGNFYLDSGKVYFKTEKSLPSRKPSPGRSIVIGGIKID